MIGGTDIVIPAAGGSAALDLCTRIVWEYLPQARFEDGVTCAKYQQYAEIPFASLRELLIYRDAQTEADWDAGDANAPENSMLYLILAKASITVVLNDPRTEEMRSIVESLRAGGMA